MKRTLKKTLVSLIGFALLGASYAGHAGAPPGVSPEDRQQILDLISTYSYTYDARDIEGFVALFTEDCVWEAFANGAAKPTVRAANRGELRAVVAQRLAMLQQKGIQSRHYQTNTLLVARADGQVEGTTMLNLVWQQPNEKPSTVMTGVYRDLFVKTGAGWRSAKRSFFMDQGEFSK
jgi:3-phenylpropionate/cinnamic acid dioxygenase small subunit